MDCRLITGLPLRILILLRDYSEACSFGAKSFVFQGAVCNKNLLSYMKNKWGKAFFVRYGSKEVGTIAQTFQCGKMHVYNFMFHSNAVSLEDKKSVLRLKQEKANGVCSTFDISDNIVISSKQCECGKAGSVISKIHGRTDNAINIGNCNITESDVIKAMESISSNLLDVRMFWDYNKRIGKVFYATCGKTTCMEQKLVRNFWRQWGVKVRINYVCIGIFADTFHSVKPIINIANYSYD